MVETAMGFKWIVYAVVLKSHYKLIEAICSTHTLVMSKYMFCLRLDAMFIANITIDKKI